MSPSPSSPWHLAHAASHSCLADLELRPGALLREPGVEVRLLHHLDVGRHARVLVPQNSPQTPLVNVPTSSVRK